MHYFQGSREHRPPLGGLIKQELYQLKISIFYSIKITNNYYYLYDHFNDKDIDGRRPGTKKRESSPDAKVSL